jgi:hypothetical protein
VLTSLDTLGSWLNYFRHKDREELDTDDDMMDGCWMRSGSRLRGSRMKSGE